MVQLTTSHLPFPFNALPLVNPTNQTLIMIMINVESHYDDDQLWSAKICFLRFAIRAVSLSVCHEGQSDDNDDDNDDSVAMCLGGL